MTKVEIFLARLIGKDPWYTNFACTSSLSFNIDGIEYSNVGKGKMELMALE